MTVAAEASSTWVKVCGLTERAHVEAAVAAGADAVGFVLAPSPRRVGVSEARVLGADVDCLRIVVTVDTPPETLLRAAEQAEADGVQPHGLHSESAAAAARAAGLFVMRPVPITGHAIDLADVASDEMPLFDTGIPGVHGGTGQTFDWNLLDRIDRPFVLAGGLGPANIGEAVRRVRPWGVDASSALESAPGQKDIELIKAFVRGAKT